MEFFRRAGPLPARLGILPGTFNPVTVAHMALAEAALEAVDEVVFVLPRLFPHKAYSGAGFEERIAMLHAAIAAHPAFSVAASDGGLYLEIADECRAAYGPAVRLACLCGRDAAERILAWEYGRPGVPEEMLHSFDLLVANRAGGYVIPPRWSHAIRTLSLAGPFDHVSASEVRERAASGQPWEHLVPPAIRGEVRRIYGPTGLESD